MGILKVMYEKFNIRCGVVRIVHLYGPILEVPEEKGKGGRILDRL